MKKIANRLFEKVETRVSFISLFLEMLGDISRAKNVEIGLAFRMYPMTTSD